MAVAGLAVFFCSKVHKSATWMKFDNVHLTDDQVLTLGHCNVTAKIAGRRDAAKKVTFLAAENSQFWEQIIMWG
jgi:hypothetical protein